jgi:hypothetical protein
MRTSFRFLSLMASEGTVMKHSQFSLRDIVTNENVMVDSPFEFYGVKIRILTGFLAEMIFGV